MSKTAMKYNLEWCGIHQVYRTASTGGLPLGDLPRLTSLPDSVVVITDNTIRKGDMRRHGDNIVIVDDPYGWAGWFDGTDLVTEKYHLWDGKEVPSRVRINTLGSAARQLGHLRAFVRFAKQYQDIRWSYEGGETDEGRV